MGKYSSSKPFYDDAVEIPATAAPTESNDVVDGIVLSQTYKDQKTRPLTFWQHTDGSKASKQLRGARSIMNENVGINYRTIFNGYATEKRNFTLLDDYSRCMAASTSYGELLKDKKNPTYANIIKWYSKNDSQGLAKYRMQDFIYLKYYNQIPNNHMITLRRYSQPVPDHVFSLDMSASDNNSYNGFPEQFFALATAVTYMGEQTGNKLSEILKFDYGAKWETKTAQVNQLQSSDGGLAAQMEGWGISNSSLSGTNGKASTSLIKDAAATAAVSAATGKSVGSIHASQHAYPQDAFLAQYGEEFYGDINSICETSMRARGLTFTNNFTLNFEYSLKSLKCVNPKVAMMDILSNFLLLTGNYGEFWGGATIYYGVKNIAPQFGDPQLLRDGKYGQYLNTLANDVRKGFETFKNSHSDKDGNFNLQDAVGSLLKGGLQALLGNLIGGNIGVAGEAQAPPALLSGEPTGFWHLTIGNPLDPIAMMGNMKIEKTTVQFNDVLGYDDFPTEIKFTVDMAHAKPRDNGGIENMFNGNKGRFYTLSKDLNQAFEINYNKTRPNGFQQATTTGNQEANIDVSGSGHGSATESIFTTSRLKIVGSMLN